MSVLLAILVYALWTTIYPLAKLNLEHAPPLFLVGTRMLLGGILLLVFLLFQNRSLFKISLKTFLSLCLFAIISVYISNAFECWGLQYLSAAKACFIFSLSPFFSVIFSYLHFNEKMSLRKFIGLMIGFAGILPVLWIQKGSDELMTSFTLLSWAELSLMGAVATSVYGWVLLRKLVKEISPSMANGTSMLIGGCLALIHSMFVENWAPIPVPRAEWASFGQVLLIMVVISNLLCYNLYGMLLKRLTVTLLCFIGLFSPVFASLSSWAILGESPSLSMFYSTAILLIGLWIVYSEELKQGYLSNKPQTAQTTSA